MKEDSVVKNRDKYIGGSDIPILMGISPFKTRWQLILDKTEPENRKEITSPQIEYGNEMEPVIRDFVNHMLQKKFIPDVKIVDDLRGNCDGLSEDSILEIKTTSQIHSELQGYKGYLVQLLFYMDLYNKDLGYLAVYERPDDYSHEFDSERLQLFKVNKDEYTDLLEEINIQVNKFRIDVERVRENPFLTEQDLQPQEIVVLANKIASLEKNLMFYKQMETEYNQLREKMYVAMQSKGIPDWTTDRGVKFTVVKEGQDKVVQEFDEKTFKIECPEVYRKYLKDKIKKGKSGYVRVTMPKQINYI